MRGPIAAALLLGATVNLVPNNPHPAWYAAPEIACDLVTSDEDQWRCDEDPVVWRRFDVVRPSAARP